MEIDFPLIALGFWQINMLPEQPILMIKCPWRNLLLQLKKKKKQVSGEIYLMTCINAILCHTNY